MESINRDRCGTYADGAARGSPEAVQIADRFHLVLNLSTAIERALEERRHELESPPSNDDSDPKPEQLAEPSKPETDEQRRQQQRRQRRLERYQQVIELSRGGSTQKVISKAVGVSLKTVRRWLRAQQFPERKKPTGRRSHVREFDQYLRQRWEQGCRNSTQLYREIRGHGYRGGRQMVSHHVAQWRVQAKTNRKGAQRIAPKDAALIICKRPEQRSTQQNELLGRLLGRHPTFHWLHFLASDFRDTLQSRDGNRLRDWIRNATESGIDPIVRFAYGLRRDIQAVTAAVETHWSSGQVEGHINRLKSIKRQMYGRAGFTLLRARVLPYAPAIPP